MSAAPTVVFIGRAPADNQPARKPRRRSSDDSPPHATEWLTGYAPDLPTPFNDQGGIDEIAQATAGFADEYLAGAQ
ncbi:MULTISPECIES: hypothetical protein [unclassified Bradyrhizobium]|uniref:hypothetical protein n=1 Tax=unclassified Bradyrhizobium TaxID=2631580 RepID=UPI00247AEC85|nr:MULTISPECIES: hypothetical protein [unclassified Bradyrhizobium]WGS22227.1 hypothetical protein MTX22_11440 [Bradyrhizobium sp. ISRA463]WGS29194.1 hypothetical protein MTX19_09220 [Bradyrhizobium sp. ISRA464]